MCNEVLIQCWTFSRRFWNIFFLHFNDYSLLSPEAIFSCLNFRQIFSTKRKWIFQFECISMSQNKESNSTLRWQFPAVSQLGIIIRICPFKCHFQLKISTWRSTNFWKKFSTFIPTLHRACVKFIGFVRF